MTHDDYLSERDRDFAEDFMEQERQRISDNNEEVPRADAGALTFATGMRPFAVIHTGGDMLTLFVGGYHMIHKARRAAEKGDRIYRLVTTFPINTWELAEAK